MNVRRRVLRAVRAVRSLRLPEPDGLAAGAVLAAANVLGLGAVACATWAVPAASDAPPTGVLDDARPAPGPGPVPVPGRLPHAADGREERR